MAVLGGSPPQEVFQMSTGGEMSTDWGMSAGEGARTSRGMPTNMQQNGRGMTM